MRLYGKETRLGRLALWTQCEGESWLTHRFFLLRPETGRLGHLAPANSVVEGEKVGVPGPGDSMLE